MDPISSGTKSRAEPENLFRFEKEFGKLNQDQAKG